MSTHLVRASVWDQEIDGFVTGLSRTPVRGCDLVAAKSALLSRLLGPAADAEVVGPMTEPGRVNGLVVHAGEVVAYVSSPPASEERERP
jgi:hypothetical protein